VLEVEFGSKFSAVRRGTHHSLVHIKTRPMRSASGNNDKYEDSGKKDDTTHREEEWQ
jgi:hypothetical protein